MTVEQSQSQVEDGGCGGEEEDNVCRLPRTLADVTSKD